MAQWHPRLVTISKLVTLDDVSEIFVKDFFVGSRCKTAKSGKTATKLPHFTALHYVDTLATVAQAMIIDIHTCAMTRTRYPNVQKKHCFISHRN